MSQGVALINCLPKTAWPRLYFVIHVIHSTEIKSNINISAVSETRYERRQRKPI